MLGVVAASSFKFGAAVDGRGGSQCNMIRDFGRKEGDMIDLPEFDMNTMKGGEPSFKFIGNFVAWTS